MAEKMTGKLRLLYLRELLMSKTSEEHPLSVPQMIEFLAQQGIPTDRRTIYDDLEALRMSGMDIEKIQTRTHGYYLASRVFELPELKLLADAVQSSRFITAKKSRELIGKIGMLSDEYTAKNLAREVYVQNRVKTMNESIYYNVDEIHRAIAQSKKLRFLYCEYGEDKKLHPRRGGEVYRVSPYMLVWDDENYYLVAYHERYGKITHFRVDKMLFIAMEEEPARPVPEDFDADAYAGRTFGMFAGEQQRVVMWFESSLLGVVIDRFGKDIPLFSKAQNGFCTELNVALSDAFFAWVFQFGKRAKIMAPDAVAEQMKNLLKRNLEDYEQQ